MHNNFLLIINTFGSLLRAIPSFKISFNFTRFYCVDNTINTMLLSIPRRVPIHSHNITIFIMIARSLFGFAATGTFDPL